jgi:hypothetical protein
MHPRRFVGKLILIILLAAPSVAWAALPLITDDTGTQGTGKFQVEASGVWSTQQTNENVQGGRESNSIADFTLTAGISETVDFTVDIPYV